MFNRWDVAAVAFLLCFSAFLINLITQNTIALKATLGATQSQLLYNTALNGKHDPALISFRGFKLGGVSVFLEPLCNCSIRRLSDPTYSSRCMGMPAPITTNMVGIGNINYTQYWDSFFEVPGDRTLGEYLMYQCYHPGQDGLSIASSPFGASFARLLEAAMHPDPNYINDFYARYFITRPLPYNPTGHYNTLLLEKSIFLKVGEKVNESNTYITLQASRTKHEDGDYTEFKVAWQSDLYLVVQEIKLGNILMVFAVIATPSLLFERLVTLFSKLKRKGEFLGGVQTPPEPPPAPGEDQGQPMKSMEPSDEVEVMNSHNQNGTEHIDDILI